MSNAKRRGGPPRRHHLTGRVFFRLSVEQEGPEHRQPGGVIRRTWWCRCSCGTTLLVQQAGLLSGNSRSCGCWNREQAVTTNTTHGLSVHADPAVVRVHSLWKHMMARCYCPKACGRRWKDYGGRGITVCARWRDPVTGPPALLADLGPCPAGYELDRIDPNGNYEPANCRWIPRCSGFTRRSIVVEFNGTQISLAELSRRTGNAYKKLLYRHHHGLPLLA